jgi:hypothetical protein
VGVSWPKLVFQPMTAIHSQSGVWLFLFSPTNTDRRSKSMKSDEFVIYPIRLARTTYNKLGDRSRTLEISRADLIRMVLREALKAEAPTVAPEVTQPAAEAQHA